MNGSADTEIALFLRRVKWAVMGAFALWVLWLLAPILTPFVVALMLAWQLLRHYRGRQRLQARNLGFGLLLGAINFGNILFYVRAHQALPHSPATIFAGMNIGVVCLGALVGVLAFGEKTSAWNRVGLGLAVVAIALIARGAQG